MTAKIQEVYDFIIPEMAAAGFEDTPENREQCLRGLRDGWVEDHSDDCPEKSEWVFAVSMEIFKLRMSNIARSLFSPPKE
jgi:hypothetical protein